MFCPECGSSVPDGSKFCSACGSSLLQYDARTVWIPFDEPDDTGSASQFAEGSGQSLTRNSAQNAPQSFDVYSSLSRFSNAKVPFSSDTSVPAAASTSAPPPAQPQQTPPPPAAQPLASQPLYVSGSSGARYAQIPFAAPTSPHMQAAQQTPPQYSQQLPRVPAQQTPPQYRQQPLTPAQAAQPMQPTPSQYQRQPQTPAPPSPPRYSPLTPMPGVSLQGAAPANVFPNSGSMLADTQIKGNGMSVKFYSDCLEYAGQVINYSNILAIDNSGRYGYFMFPLPPFYISYFDGYIRFTLRNEEKIKIKVKGTSALGIGTKKKQQERFHAFFRAVYQIVAKRMANDVLAKIRQGNTYTLSKYIQVNSDGVIARKWGKLIHINRQNYGSCGLDGYTVRVLDINGNKLYAIDDGETNVLLLPYILKALFGR